MVPPPVLLPKVPLLWSVDAQWGITDFVLLLKFHCFHSGKLSQQNVWCLKTKFDIIFHCWSSSDLCRKAKQIASLLVKVNDASFYFCVMLESSEKEGKRQITVPLRPRKKHLQLNGNIIIMIINSSEWTGELVQISHCYSFTREKNAQQRSWLIMRGAMKKGTS